MMGRSAEMEMGVAGERATWDPVTECFTNVLRSASAQGHVVAAG